MVLLVLTRGMVTLIGRVTNRVEAKNVLNIMQCTGQPPHKTYVDQNINRVEVEKWL